MIDLVFPLSLPLSSNDLDGQGQARRQKALATIRGALTGAGLQRSRRLALRPEGDGVPKALAHEQWLQQLLGSDLPDVANTFALRGQAGGLEPAPAGRQAWLLRPVHLHLGLDHLVLAAGEAASFALNNPEAWIARLSEALEPGWALQAWSGPRGETFLRLETPDSVDWQPRSGLQATGRSIEVYLPQGRDARLWRRFLNHAQMLLHEHPLNDLRAGAGQPPVNGLWLEGRIHDPGPLSLKRLTGSEVPQTASSAPATSARQILLFEDWIGPVQQGDGQAWEAAWQRFPEVASQLRQNFSNTGSLNWHFFGEAARLSLQSSAGDPLRFWRRPLPSVI